MNDTEKDLLNENDLVNESQTINKVQPIDENTPINDLEPVSEVEAKNEKVEDAPIENVEAKSEIVEAKNEIVEAKNEIVDVKNIDEPTEDVLFGGYEVKNWEFSPRIYKIIGSAAVFNLLALFVIAQTNMLSTSACESPFVDRVCQVLDTVYVGSKLFNGSNEAGREVFDPTVIDSKDVVWVNEGGLTPPISYPEGYFQVANKDEIEQLKLQEDLLANGFNNPTTVTSTPPYSSGGSSTPFTPTQIPRKSSPKTKSPTYRAGNRKSRSSGGSLIDKKQVLPPQRKSASKGKVDGGLFSVEGDDDNNKENTAANNDGDNNKDPKKEPKKDAIAENSAKNSKPVKLDINKLPWERFFIKILDKQAENEIEIKKPFSIKLKGQLNKDGTFNADQTRYLSIQGDEAIINIAKGGIEALGDSKFLKYLTDLDVKEIEITVVQNGDLFQAQVVSGQKTPELAKLVASGLNGLIAAAKYAKKKEIDGGEKDPVKRQSEIDQLFLLQNTKVANQGNNFVLKIDLPRATAQEMIKRNLDAQAKKRKEDPDYGNPDKPNGSAKTAKLADNKAK